jgi:3-hydroxyisobutyrate dehydrogenase-like beta-hydroxyacid dehydrogenase
VVGGKREVYEKVLPLLEPLSETTHYMGENGRARR